MTTTELIKRHQTCIEILEAVDTYERKIVIAKWDMQFGYIGTFPELIRECRHNIEIYQMCIERLMKRYENL